MTPPRNALIIGGGIAGAATAMALQKAGIEPVVFEARPSAAGEGAFLTLGSNGIEALRLLGPRSPARARLPDAGDDAAQRHGQAPRRGARQHRAPGGPTSRTLKRSDLAGALLDEVERRGIRVEHGRRFVGAEERPTACAPGSPTASRRRATC